jgi:protease-4
VFGAKGKSMLPHIARVNIDGVIMDETKREQVLHDIAEDDTVKAVIVRIDSPGGTVVGSEIIYKGLRKIAEDKPVVAVISSMGASGGYIAALGADRIYARDNSLTGSIGVIFQSPEFSKLMGTIGVNMNEVKSAPLKGGPSPFAPMSDDMRQSIKVMVDDAFDWFKGIVVERRKLTPEELAAVSDGRVFSGRQAIPLKLVDALGGEQDAIDWLEKDRKISKDLPVVDADKEREFPFMAKAMALVFGDTRLADRLSLDGVLALWQP